LTLSTMVERRRMSCINVRRLHSRSTLLW
jgi:hypothetical protein